MDDRTAFERVVPAAAAEDVEVGSAVRLLESEHLMPAPAERDGKSVERVAGVRESSGRDQRPALAVRGPPDVRHIEAMQ